MATKKSAAPAANANNSKKTAAKKAEFKLDAKTRARMDKALGRTGEDDEESEDGEGDGKIVSILKLYTKGFSKKEIVAYGYNRSTVYRQCKELDRAKKGPLMQYYGFEAYEGRIQRVMKAKGMTRDKAVEYILAKDIE